MPNFLYIARGLFVNTQRFLNRIGEVSLGKQCAITKYIFSLNFKENFWFWYKLFNHCRLNSYDAVKIRLRLSLNNKYFIVWK